MIISQYPPVNGIPLYQTDSQSWDVTQVGQRFQLNGGESEVVLVKAGAVDVVPGKLYQAPAIVSAHQALAVLAAAVGATTISVTMGGTGVTLNQYQGGFLFVTDGPGAGQKFTIQENPVIASSTTGIITLQDNTVAVALTTSSKVSLFPNDYNGVIVNPTTATNSPVGISFYTIPAGTFGYLATRGQWACLNDGGTTVGLGLAPSGSVAGALATVAATTNQVASAAQTQVDTKYDVVYVNL